MISKLLIIFGAVIILLMLCSSPRCRLRTPISQISTDADQHIFRGQECFTLPALYLRLFGSAA